MRSLILTAILCAGIEPAHAALEEWSFAEVDGLCVIEKTFTASAVPTTMTIYSKQSGEYLLTMSNNGWSTEEGQKFVVALRMDKSLSVHHSVGGKDGSVSVILDDAQFRKFQAASTMVAMLTSPARILEAFDLSGSRSAAAKLIWCNVQHEEAMRESAAEERRLKERERIIPRDPFTTLQR